MSFFRRNRTAVAALVIGAVLVSVGLWRGEAETVFRKASNVCMECIGLG